MIAYKAFKPGLIATLGAGKYQYHAGLNTASEANCRKNGFHCAEDPLDCLSYYSWDGKNEFWMVDAAGDIDEDDLDSKISCTEMTLIKRLTLAEYLGAACVYMIEHPKRKWNSKVQKNKGEAQNGFCIVRGRNPIAKAQRVGDVLVLLRDDGAEIYGVKMMQPDKIRCYLDMTGKVVANA